MELNFKIVSEAKFATMEKDPRTFYRVITGSYSLSIGLWDNYFNLIETWEELQKKGLDLSKDYSDNPLDDDYFDKPGSGSAKDVLGDISGVLVVPDSIGKIGANALRGSGITGLTSPSSSSAADPGVVNVPSGTSVGANAFNGTGAEEVNIPENAGKINANAFNNTPAAQSNDINMGGHPVQNLDIDPDDSTGVILEKGYYYKVTALYNFIDDVTHESTIVSSDDSIVKFVPDCFLKAVDVGTAIISGTYTPPGGSKRYAEIECTVVNNGSGITTHVGGHTVIENETEYSYDEVVYCLDCGIELSRVTVYKDPKIYGGVYGAKWLGTSDSSWSRTDDAIGLADPVPAVNNGDGSSPFDEIMPWKGMERVEDAEAGSLVKIPKYWFKWTKTGSAMQLQISNAPKSGFFTSPAHANRGDGEGERDFVYVGRYHCSTNNYKSESRVKPKYYETIDTFGRNISALGDTIWQWDYAMYWTVMMLYLVEYASWDAQAKIGYGCSPDNQTMVKSGYTDRMTYHTGTDRANRTTYGGTQYRYIEGLWDNCRDFVDGIALSSHNVYCENNPANNGGFHKGQLIYSSRPYSEGSITSYYIPSVSGCEYALFPSAVNSSNNVYVTDKYKGKEGYEVIYVGGNATQTRESGPFFMDGINGAYGASTLGSRLMKLPNNETNNGLQQLNINRIAI